MLYVLKSSSLCVVLLYVSFTKVVKITFQSNSGRPRMAISPLSFMVAKVYLLVKSTSSVQPFKVMPELQILVSPFLYLFHLTICNYV